MDNLQKLPPKQAKFCLRILKFIQSLQADIQGKNILITYSGGIDSTALLLFFKVIQEKYNLNLGAIHVNHCLRQEADFEADHCKNICEKLEIPFFLHKENVAEVAEKEKIGTEEAGRKVRYLAFEQAEKEFKADYIVLAHHLNDLAEDMLLRLVRGASINNLMGMEAIDNIRKILRPFLLTPKKELEKFVQACSFSYVEDDSNNHLIYKRNRMRHKVMPLLEEENPAFLEQVKSLWLQANTDKNYWHLHVEPYFSKEPELPFKFPLDALRKAHKALRLRVLSHLIKELGFQPNYNQLEELDRGIMSHKGALAYEFSKGLVLEIRKNFLYCNTK